MLTCECGYTCVRKQNLDRHRRSDKHEVNLSLLELNIVADDYGKYVCTMCGYATMRRDNYRKHVNSSKHKNKKEEQPPVSKDDSLRPVLLFEVMEMFLKHQTEIMKVSAETSEKQQIQHTEMFRALTDRVVAHHHQQQLISGPQNVFLQQATTTTNSHNTKFNLNLFLNEECKNAQNLTDFVKNVIISIEDLEHLGEVGYTEGMSKILSKAMQSKETTKRPIHCTDLKRETIYVRENDAWKIDMQREETIKAIEHIANKNYKTFKEWRDLHPEHAIADTEDYETWYRISRNMCNTDPTAMKKLVHHLATMTAIEKGDSIP